MIILIKYIDVVTCMNLINIIKSTEPAFVHQFIRNVTVIISLYPGDTWF